MKIWLLFDVVFKTVGIVFNFKLLTFSTNSAKNKNSRLSVAKKKLMIASVVRV